MAPQSAIAERQTALSGEVFCDAQSTNAMRVRVQGGKESDLIAAILGGDTEIYQQLIRPYERIVYIMSLTYLRNETDAEDVAQETFLRAFQNLQKFRGESKFSTWLISIALNEARSQLRRRTTIRILSLDEPQDPEMPSPPAHLRDWRDLPSIAVERDEIQRLLQGAVESLPKIYKQVFLLREIEDFNIKETAEILGISPSLVKVRLHRARIMLQKLLAPQLKRIEREPMLA
jgi:RNA polymerase sigma-70 factor (ECF subfamily)